MKYRKHEMCVAVLRESAARKNRSLLASIPIWDAAFAYSSQTVLSDAAAPRFCANECSIIPHSKKIGILVTAGFWAGYESA